MSIKSGVIIISLIIFYLSLTVCNTKHHNLDGTDVLIQYSDTLIGRFNGKDIDTLICEPMNRKDEIGLCYWKIYSMNKTVETLFISKR